MTEKNLKPRFSIFKIIGISFLLASLFVGTFIWYVQQEPKLGGDFSLTFRNQPWSFSDDAKDLNLLYFGYAKCPDVCPLTLSHAGAAFKKLKPDELPHVRLIFLSVDADNDKPEDVANYASQFSPLFFGMSGSREQIDQTVSLFKASYIVEKDPKSYLGYSISHTDRLYFLNKKGIVVTTIPIPRSDDEILKTIRENL